MDVRAQTGADDGAGNGAQSELAIEGFTARLVALGDQIDRLRRTLAKLSEVDESLSGRVGVRFGKLLEKCERQLLALEAQAGGPTPEIYRKLREARAECARLVQECFGFTQGALLRSSGLDEGLCVLADKLLADLDQRAELGWRRLTVLAETDFYGDVAEIIRLRFPDLSVWTLPVAAHELGHFVGPELRLDVRDSSYRGFEYPFQIILRREWGVDPQRWHFMHEYFADIFATYAVGPAFVYACVVLRFDPDASRRDSGFHPSPAKRFYLMRKTLDRLDALEFRLTSPYPAVISDLDNRWRAGIAAAGDTDELAESSMSGLDVAFGEIYPLLEETVSAIRYSTLGKARTFMPQLVDRGQLAVRDVSVTDVLNAAWLSRVQHARDRDVVRTIGERALEACRLL